MDCGDGGNCFGAMFFFSIVFFGSYFFLSFIFLFFGLTFVLEWLYAAMYPIISNKTEKYIGL